MLSQPFVKEIVISEKQKTTMSKINLFNFLALLFLGFLVFYFLGFFQHLVSPSNMVNTTVCVTFWHCFLHFLCTKKGDSKEVVSVHSYSSNRPVLRLIVAYERKLSGCHCHPLCAEEC